MEEEEVMKEEAKKKKRDIWWIGGPKFGPHIKVLVELLSQLPKKKLLFFSIPRKKKNQNHIMKKEKSKNQIFKKKKKESMKIFWNGLNIKLQVQISKLKKKTPNPKFSNQNFHSQV